MRVVRKGWVAPETIGRGQAVTQINAWLPIEIDEPRLRRCLPSRAFQTQAWQKARFSIGWPTDAPNLKQNAQLDLDAHRFWRPLPENEFAA